MPHRGDQRALPRKMKCLPLTLSHGETGLRHPSASSRTLPAFPGKPGASPGPALMPLAPSPGPRDGQEDRPTESDCPWHPAMGTQQLLRGHFQWQGLSKRTPGKRAGSAEWQVCPPRGWEEVIRVWIRVVSCRGTVGWNEHVCAQVYCVSTWGIVCAHQGCIWSLLA